MSMRVLKWLLLGCLTCVFIVATVQGISAILDLARSGWKSASIPPLLGALTATFLIQLATGWGISRLSRSLRSSRPLANR